MKNNRFVVITTAYNKEKWIGFTINSIKQQSYRNFLSVIGYDKSRDATREVIVNTIRNESQFILHDVPNQESQMNNFFSCLAFLKENNLINPEDIIVEIDGDDWLLHAFVFQMLNEVYEDDNIWMTYGQYISYPTAQLGGHFNMKLEDDVDQRNAYRTSLFPYSHLKTYKAWLFDRVPKNYFINPETGKYWGITADFAMCMPMVEMAGKKRIFRIDEPIYVYNMADDADNESKSGLQEQKRIEQKIRQFKPCERLISKTPTTQVREITAVFTSCNRFDLLERTLNSFVQNSGYPIKKLLIIDNSAIPNARTEIEKITSHLPNVEIIINETNIGQISSIDKAYSTINTEFIFHCEDDWEFFDSDFVRKSIEVLDHDKNLINVNVRVRFDGERGSMHPITSPKTTNSGLVYHEYVPNYLGAWHGFSWNPGLRRLSDYNDVKPYKQYGDECYVGLEYYKRGKRSACLEKSYCKHIGLNGTLEGRNT